MRVVRKFKDLLMWTFTIDPTLFSSPADAYRHVQTDRCIGEWVRSMWKAGYLHSRRYFCVVEWQMGKGEKAGAHYGSLPRAAGCRNSFPSTTGRAVGFIPA